MPKARRNTSKVSKVQKRKNPTPASRKTARSVRRSKMSAPSPSPPGFRSSSTWTPQDDETLLAARAQGLNWAPIAEQYFPGKTPNACRKRYERLIERRNAEDWDGSKLETLAQEYMKHRETMWRMVADQLGEKWQTVEAKCMEKGVRNLAASARNFERRRASAKEEESPSTDEDVEMQIDPPRSAQRLVPGHYRAIGTATSGAGRDSSPRINVSEVGRESETSGDAAESSKQQQQQQKRRASAMAIESMLASDD